MNTEAPTRPTIVGLPSTTSNARSRITRLHLLIIGIVVLGLLSLGLLVTVIVQAKSSRETSSPETKNDYCLNDGCLSAATYQLRSMNKNASASRCTDFYRYACGGWEEKHVILSSDVERTILGDVLNRRDADIERLLNSPISRMERDGWEYKLKVS